MQFFPVSRLLDVAEVAVLKRFVYDSNRVVRHLVYLNSNSTEEIKLMVKAFNKFGNLAIQK